MKSKDEIQAKIDRIEADDRYYNLEIDFEINEPLAIIQTGMAAEIRALNWVLENK